ncbi:unnamed protein product [Dicrocoelium dendriticum]|nr:unnamed protein product [Dicrocoelium dendriticum]
MSLDKRKLRGQYILLGCGIITSSAIYALSCFIAPAFRRICLPFVPATTAQIDSIANILETVQRTESHHSLGTLVDLGSGDGRVLIDLLRRPQLHFENAVGIDLNRPLVWYSRWNGRRVGMKRPLLTFKHGNLWTTDLSKYKTIVLFGVDCMMEKFEDKVKQEVLPNTFVLTCRFPLPRTSPEVCIDEGPDSVYFYRF